MYIIVVIVVVSDLKNVNTFLSLFFGREKKREKKGAPKRTKSIDLHFPPKRVNEARRAIARKKSRGKSRGSDVSKTFGVVVCEPRVVRHAFAFVRVDGRSGAVFEKRLYRERDVERDR